MVLITKSFLVKVLMGVQKRYICASISNKGKADMSDKEAEVFLMSYILCFLSLSRYSGVCMLFSGYFPAVDGALPQGRSP